MGGCNPSLLITVTNVPRMCDLEASRIPVSHSYAMAQGLNKNIHFPILILTCRTTANIEGFKIRKGKNKTA